MSDMTATDTNSVAATPTSTEVSGAEIRLDDVTKRYPGQHVAAVDGLSLDIPAGEIVIFVGPSGCGKTTTLKMINRLIEPTSGTIRSAARTSRGMAPTSCAAHIGYVIQGGSLFPHMTVAQNIAHRAEDARLGRRPDHRAGSRSCSSWSASTRASTAAATRASSPAASSSGSASPAASPPTRP